MERHYLQLLYFYVDVTPRCYDSYYFDLCFLAHDNNVVFKFSPLSKQKAQKLKAIS